MLSKFSIKKPMTVFVCVILVFVLGITSFFNMTPDLLPNMDFPYAIIMTTYPGQTPETVESTVSKPLEQSMSTIDGVKEITSTSSENYSLLMIEFEDGTNMDTATVDMRSGLDAISDAWPDAVGTPYMIKVNPNILPVALVAVDYGDKDRNEISRYVENELLNKLEGIDGVASVSTKGLVTESENVVLSQSKIDKLNTKIESALNDQFGEAEEKINSAKEEIEENIKKAESGATTVSSSIEDIKEQQSKASEELKKAQTQADNGKTEILNAKIKLLDQKSSLALTKQGLEIAYQGLLDVKNVYDDLVKQKAELTEQLSFLNDINDRYTRITEQIKDAAEGTEIYKQLTKQLEEIKEELKKYEISPDDLPETIKNAYAAIDSLSSSFENVNKKLQNLGTSAETLDSSIKSVAEKIEQVDSGIAQIDEAVNGLDEKNISVNQALATISQQQSSADFQMSSALTTLVSKQSEINNALTQLDKAKEEVDSSMKTLSEKKEEAKSKADMSNTVTMDNVSSILTAQNFSMPAGYVTDDENNKFMVRVGDKVRSFDELQSLVLFDTGITGIGAVKLSDVADVFAADDSEDVYAKINGNSGVVVSFSKQSDAATSTVCENINNGLKKLSENTEGLTFTTLYNQGDYINIIVNNVLKNLLMGALLAIIILFLFLRDIKPTIIIAFSIPISVIFAIVLMYFSGVTLNMISLSGLAIGVGMLVDNSVVVIENIYRLRSMGVSAAKAALNGARQVAGAIMASTLTTICVFLPIVFVDGVTRQLFTDMALTIAYSLLASLIVALTLVPAMGKSMLKNIKMKEKKEPGKIVTAYEKSLRFVLKHKVPALLVAIALLVVSSLGAVSRGFSFMPEMSSSEIQVSVKLDDNATLSDTVEVAEQISKKLNEFEEFDTVGVMTGSTTSLMGLTGNSSSNDAGSVVAYGVLGDKYTKKSEKISKDVEKALASVDGEVTVSGGSAGAMSSMFGDGSIGIVLYGDDLDTMKSTAEDMAEQLKTIDGIESADSGVGATSPEIRVTVDKSKAAQKSLTVAQVYQQVAAAISDEKTSTTLTNDSGDEVNVVVVKDEGKKISADGIKNIDLKYTDKEGNEKTVKLSSVAEISNSESMNSISRQNQKRYISLTGTVKEGYTVTDVSNEVKNLFDNYDLPSGCSVEYSGSNETTMEAVYQLLKMLLLGVILIYLIMVAQFQSLKSPFIIMFTIPLAFTGGFLALLITGFDISVVSLVGFVMLCGIIVNNGIVLVDYINRLRVEGMERREAIVEAGKTRMRPILITALTTVLGLSTMAIGIGTGSEMMQPIAIVCIGGLLYATLMTLYIVPVIYDMFNKKEIKSLDESDLEFIDD